MIASEPLRESRLFASSQATNAPGDGAAARPVTVLGLLGGIASGKSLVAHQLASLGAVVLDADRAAHEALNLPDVRQALVERWGAQVLDPQGKVDRAQVAPIVFGDSPQARAELVFLEGLTHPRVGELLLEQARRAVEEGARVLVLDVPLLLKAGWDRFCDKIVYVDAPRSQRVERAVQTRGWSSAEFDRREALQETLEMKKGRADIIIDNSTSPDSTRVQVERLWHSLG